MCHFHDETVYCSKIDRDRAKNVKLQILENNSFCLKIMLFLTKTVIFKILRFTFFAISWSIFELYRLILPFWNYQSLIIKMAHRMFKLGK